MFRVQTKKERIAQANSERTVKVPSASRSRAGAGEASSRLKGSSNTARAARLSSFSAAHLPKNRGGIKRRSKTTPPQAPSRGGKQNRSPSASSRWAGQTSSPGASSRGGKQTGSRGKKRRN